MAKMQIFANRRNTRARHHQSRIKLTKGEKCYFSDCVVSHGLLLMHCKAWVIEGRKDPHTQKKESREEEKKTPMCLTLIPSDIRSPVRVDVTYIMGYFWLSSGGVVSHFHLKCCCDVNG